MCRGSSYGETQEAAGLSWAVTTPPVWLEPGPIYPAEHAQDLLDPHTYSGPGATVPVDDDRSSEQGSNSPHDIRRGRLHSVSFGETFIFISAVGENFIEIWIAP